MDVEQLDVGHRHIIASDVLRHATGHSPCFTCAGLAGIPSNYLASISAWSYVSKVACKRVSKCLLATLIWKLPERFLSPTPCPHRSNGTAPCQRGEV